MKWTKEKPTEEGWYWYVGESEYDEPMVVEVHRNAAYKDLEAAVYRDDPEPVENIGGLWSSSPIPLPEKENE